MFFISNHFETLSIRDFHHIVSRSVTSSNNKDDLRFNRTALLFYHDKSMGFTLEYIRFPRQKMLSIILKQRNSLAICQKRS